MYFWFCDLKDRQIKCWYSLNLGMPADWWVEAAINKQTPWDKEEERTCAKCGCSLLGIESHWCHTCPTSKGNAPNFFCSDCYVNHGCKKAIYPPYHDHRQNRKGYKRIIGDGVA